MITIKFVPSYIFEVKYNMTHVHAMKNKDGEYIYQQCFGSQAAAKRKLNQLYKRFGAGFADNFIICPIEEITR